MRIDEYMTTCLLHPTLGYYTTRDPLGVQGDFTTAPEISQMFGELIGLSLGQSWMDSGAPSPFTLAELGPGRGTLMADALRACARVPGFLAAAQMVLVEASPALKSAQAKTLEGTEVHWADSVEELPQKPLFLIANEFFDVLPIRQFLCDGGGWRERQVGLDGDQLVFGLGPVQPQPALPDAEAGDLVETCAALAPTMDPIAQRLRDHGGTALVIDYGDWQTKGDTLQALRSHEKVSPLETPGQADLTAHVNFSALAEAATGCTVSALTPQGVFLERLGITARAQALALKLSGPARDSHIAAHRRLTHPAEMGNLFKVMALTGKDSVPPPGVQP
ncbi:ATP synthase beta subunit/transription termination factor rho [Sulfitobacter noctilucae]|nr:ATP synthase beta subunit/transription termination factor rho [Sulfitobacter noctilucae]